MKNHQVVTVHYERGRNCTEVRSEDEPTITTRANLPVRCQFIMKCVIHFSNEHSELFAHPVEMK